jgi:hypothetical protein
MKKPVFSMILATLFIGGCVDNKPGTITTGERDDDRGTPLRLLMSLDGPSNTQPTLMRVFLNTNGHLLPNSMEVGLEPWQNCNGE